MPKPKDTPADSIWRRAYKAGSLIRSGMNMTEACRKARIPVKTFSDHLNRTLASEFGVADRVRRNRSEARP